MKPDRVLIGWCCAVAAAMAVCALVLAPPAGVGARYTPEVSYPHTGGCVHPDAVTGPPCAAARELLLGANAGDAPMYCRHYANAGEYGACVAGVTFSDPGFSEFQTVGFRVKNATVVIDGDAVVRVHVWPFDGDGEPGDMLLFLERAAGWWRVRGYQAAPAPPAS